MLTAACVVPRASAARALKFGHQQEGLNGWDIQRGHFVITYRYD